MFVQCSLVPLYMKVQGNTIYYYCICENCLNYSGRDVHRPMLGWISRFPIQSIVQPQTSQTVSSRSTITSLPSSLSDDPLDIDLEDLEETISPANFDGSLMRA
mmetsp:Transcript_23497/g.49706  ORF Transcript_23497/g.49706 Transcript_23497/m.49706 type:complete len:103 (+) Transcript_23497:66-374(+)